MATRSRSDEEGNALLGGPSLVGSAIAVPQSFVAATASILEEGYQSKLKEASDQEQRKSRKALARRWSEPYSDDGSVDLLDATRLGLLVNYACIGFLNGLLPALVYPFFKLYLNMDGFQVSAAATVLAAIPEGMRSVVAGFVTVEIAEPGFEGATRRWPLDLPTQQRGSGASQHVLLPQSPSSGSGGGHVLEETKQA
ncbi:hypothetical protein PF006_g103 [Phytophthora fragariae]|uniref:Uncharacterized protein n=1 Tax=Phytophthora fragariae TaxID=53985 RepID=A0A6A3UZ77_9STRA|nr:hypothetical protein PF006_g103 [Phytophthora fragariae]